MISRRTTRRSARCEGVVLTEALLAISMMIVMFACVTFFHSMYSAKTDTMQRARLQAWGGTRFQCQGAEVTGTAQFAVTTPSPIVARTRGAANRTVESRAEIACNIQPSQDDDVMGVLGWALKEGSESVGSAVFSGVKNMISSGFWSAINPFD